MPILYIRHVFISILLVLYFVLHSKMNKCIEMHTRNVMYRNIQNDIPEMTFYFCLYSQSDLITFTCFKILYCTQKNAHVFTHNTL